MDFLISFLTLYFLPLGISFHYREHIKNDLLHFIHIEMYIVVKLFRVCLFIIDKNTSAEIFFLTSSLIKSSLKDNF